jgi:hypothetical protein
VLVDTLTLTLIAVKPLTDDASSRSAVNSCRGLEFTDESAMSTRRGWEYIGSRGTGDELAHKGRGQNTTIKSAHAPLPAPRRYIGLRDTTAGQNTTIEAASPSLPAVLPVVEEEDQL